MRGVRLSKSLFLSIALSACGGTAALAEVASTTFQVTATVDEACSVSASDLSFGNYVASDSSPLQGDTSVTVTCSNGAGYQIGLEVGAGGATLAERRMTSGAHALTYALFQDAEHTQLWGATGSDAQAGTGTGAAQSYRVYGRIPAGQFTAAGSYSDTINVLVTF